MEASALWRPTVASRRRPRPAPDPLRVEPLDDRTVLSTLLLATAGDMSGAGTPGLTAWTAGTVLQFGGSSFALPPARTTGTFSSLFDLNQFTDSDVKLDGLHQVRQTQTLGSGANTFAIQPGDLLLSIDRDGTTLISLNQLTVDRDDVFVFRPQAPGDYSAGTYFPLLDNLAAIHGGSDTWAVALVETDTLVGDVTLSAGSFLFSRGSGNAENDVRLFVPTGVGAGTTAGAVAVLIEGNDLGISAKVVGIDLVESPTTVGGRVLPAGTLLLAVDGDATAAGTAVTRFDVLALTVTRTTLGSGTTAGTATVLFRGADVGLDGGSEALRDVSLTAGNSPPTAADDTYTISEDTALVVAGPGVLANDSDPDGDPLAAALASGPTHGTLALNPDGSFTYTPAPDYFGPDSFTYSVTDGLGGTATGTVTIDVTPVNDPPVVANDSYTTGQNTRLTVPVPGVLGNDRDADGDPLTAALVSASAGGTVALNPDGSFAFTPDPAFRGTFTFTYRASDPSGASTTGTATIRVIPPSGAPVAQGDAYTVTEDGVLTVPPAGVLANDTPPGNLPLSAYLVSAPRNGSLVLNANGSFTYTPNPDFFGTDVFSYKAEDVNKHSGSARVRVTVTPTPDPPVGVADQFATAQDAPLVGNVLANDTDPDGDPLTAILASGPANGTVALNPDGSFTYTPAAGFTGTDSFTYRVSDGTTTSGPVTVDITVRPTPTPQAGPPDPEPTEEPPPAETDPPPNVGNPPPRPDPKPGPADEPPTGTPGGSPPGPGPAPVFTVPVGAVDLGPPGFISVPGNLGPAPVDLPAVSVLPDAPVLPDLPTIPWLPVPPTSAGEVPVGPVLVPPPEVAVAPPPRVLPPAADAALDAGLSELKGDVQVGVQARSAADVAVATGVVATAGYVFLTPKLAFWLLSALLARRAVWKPFDPIDVVYAWENDKDNRPPDDPDDESLESLVGEGKEP